MPSKSDDASRGGGALYLVATPIGNLGDVTLRAIEILGEVDAVVAEDTRRTRELLSHLGVRGKRLSSIDAHSSPRALARVTERLLAGERLAYATDAGTPGVSDPGRALVDACLDRGVDVRVVPGPSALTAAVALSGLVDGAFLFAGFLPRRGGARKRRIDSLCRSSDAAVLFESPGRTRATLGELAERCPDRRVCVARELTKVHEEVVRGTLSELSTRDGWRGEIAIVLGPSAENAEQSDDRLEAADLSLRVGIECGASPARMARRLAEATGLPRRALYERALELARALDLSGARGGEADEAGELESGGSLDGESPG